MREKFLWAQDDEAVRTDAMASRSAGENFPVALRMLPAARRRHLMAIYGFARITDDIGDEAPPAERAALLDELEADLGELKAGKARLPVIRALEPTICGLGVPEQLFIDIIGANRQDQIVSRYETFADLDGYCRLSANPIGRMVLYVFGEYSERRAELSDRVCTALQLAEHWQDVAEDYRVGRIYLPGADLREYGVAEADLAAPAASPRLLGLMTFEVKRAGELLDSGAPLVGTLRGTARLAVGGYVAGGRAALDSIAGVGYDVLAAQAVPGKRTLAAKLLRTVVTGR
ncbi:MAG TPA: squalene synthase HpnC [Streptosporangiaceae bacterium]|nr:squalene synthase HpnC [Streptosporangiaceae bacterium]